MLVTLALRFISISSTVRRQWLLYSSSWDIDILQMLNTYLWVKSVHTNVQYMEKRTKFSENKYVISSGLRNWVILLSHLTFLQLPPTPTKNEPSVNSVLTE